MSSTRKCFLVVTVLAQAAVAATNSAFAGVAASVVPGASVVTIASGLDSPVAVAFDARSGAIVVVDDSRIKRIAPDGTVSIISGSAPGYRDGDATNAAFKNPLGVAVDAAGVVYVADTGNRRIRRIAAGVVTTLVSDATFTEPVSVAAGADGALYVADTGVGIRKIDANGAITLPFGEVTKSVRDVSVSNASTPSLLFVTSDGVGRIDLTTGKLAQPPTGGVEYAPASVVALNATQFVASLPRYQALYFSTANPKYGWWRRVAGPAGNDATIAGTFADGPPEQARFSSPARLARDDAGNIIVADPGNHRVRKVPAVDLRWDSGASPVQAETQTFSIGIVGNSVAFYNTMWSDSIGGVLERRLARDAPPFLGGRPVHVRAAWLGNDLDAQDEYFDNAVVRGSYDCVLWALDFNNFAALSDWPYGNPSFDAASTAHWDTLIGRGARTLQTYGTPTVLFDVPFGFEVSPEENGAFREQYASVAPPEQRQVLRRADEGDAFVTAMEAAIRTTNLPFIPTYERILAYERGPHIPLYSPIDNHPSPAGTTFIADLIADDLEKTNACAPTHGRPVAP